MITKATVKECLRRPDWTAGELTYLSHHAARIAYAVNLVQKLREQSGASTLLDVGPHMLTTALHRLLPPGLAISTMGWAHPRMAPPELALRHIAMDLNACDIEPISCDERFDIILFAETIEHLYTAPVPVLRALGGLLSQRGVLIVQTPNAVSLVKRLKMLTGRHPFELLRTDRSNPGHIRESTLPELLAFGQQAGLRVRQAALLDFLPHRQALVRILARAVPSFRECISVCFVR